MFFFKNWGVETTQAKASRYNRKIRLTNILSGLAGAVCVFYTVVFAFFQLYGVALLYFGMVCMFMLTPILHKIQRLDLAKTSFFITAVVSLLISDFLFEHSGVEIYLIAAMILGGFIYEKKWAVWRSFWFIAIVYFYMQFNHYYHWLIYPKLLSGTVEELVFVSNTVLAILIIYLLVTYYKQDHFFYEQNIEHTLNNISHANALLLDKQELLEKKNKEFILFSEKNKDSLRYAQRIQSAFMPNKEALAPLFSDFFILNKPKDIVSGDFYWAYQNNDVLFLAVADCTGHGVPGAFMTILATNLLSKIVKEDGVCVPSDILSKLDHAIDLALHQNKNSNHLNDGLDIALVSIDLATKKMTYCAAKRPLYAFMKGSAELIEFKPNKFPIGGSEYKTKDFIQEEINIERGDIFYLFSDGYADQFGLKGKFMTKKFKALLTDIHQKKLAEQSRILHEKHLFWKLNHKQTDDILIIGFCI